MGIHIDQIQDKLKHLQSPTDITNLLSTAHAARLYAAEQNCHEGGSRSWQVRFDALDKLCDEAKAKLRDALPNSANTPHMQPLPGDSPAAHHTSTHMDDHDVNTWRMMHDHDGRTMHSIDMRQHNVYLEAIENTAHTQQPGATLQHNSTSNCSVATASRSIHATHCASSIWRARQEIAYPQHHDLMYMHYHTNSATAEMFETAACIHQTQCCVYELKIQHLAQMELDMYNALLGPTMYDALTCMDM